MKSMHRLGRNVAIAAVAAAGAFGALTLTSGVSQAARPTPDCGPTRMWICVLPSGLKVDFDGTICEKAQYERQTGAKCSPATY